MPSTEALAFISMPSGFEWIIVLVVALLLFGARLPAIMRALGSSMREFKKGVNDGMDGVEDGQQADQPQRQPNESAGTVSRQDPAHEASAAGTTEAADADRQRSL